MLTAQQSVWLPVWLPLAALVLATVSPAQRGSKIEGFEFEVTTLDGREVTQDDFRDKVLLVDFWGTWCPPCRKAVPVLARLYEKHRERGLVILGLNYEQGSEEEALRKVKTYAERNDIPYPLALGTKKIQDQVPNFGGYPTLLMFKRGLKFDRIKVGYTASLEKDLDTWIRKALGDPAPADSEQDEAGKPEDEKDEEASEPLALECVDGQKLAVSGQDRYLFLVLVHPELQPPAKDLAALEALAGKHERLEVRVVARGDLAGDVGSALRVKKDSLDKVRLGKAFPAYALFAPSGRVRYRTAGFGEGVVAALEKKVAEILKEDAEKKAKKEKGDKGRKKDAAAEKASGAEDAKKETKKEVKKIRLRGK